jgi:transcriptional regulator GlxA family with amidase domain
MLSIDISDFNITEPGIMVYNPEERTGFNRQLAKAEDVSIESMEALEFRAKITEYVLARIKDPNISICDLAYDLHLSERQLFRMAKGFIGCTPAQLVREVRLQKALELLVSGTMGTLEEVACRVGFETPAYFSKQFLERFGRRPTEFL